MKRVIINALAVFGIITIFGAVGTMDMYTQAGVVYSMFKFFVTVMIGVGLMIPFFVTRNR